MSRVKLSWGSPPCLYRAFDKLEYADQFIGSGSLLMRHIRSYAIVEDTTRADSKEGLWSWANPDGSGGGYCSPYAAYIFCVSGPTVDLKYLSRFGKFIVRINEPVQFASDIEGYIKEPVNIDCVKIRYRDVAVLKQRPTTEDAYRSTYSEKPARFFRECEYRVVAVSNIVGPGCLGYSINLKRQLTYAELLPHLTSNL